MKERGGPVVLTFGLPLGLSPEFLHVCLAGRAVALIRGEEDWEDGRLLLDWKDAGGRVVAHDTLMTFSGTDEEPQAVEMIVPSRRSGLVPVLRIEHLGVSGRMEIDSLSIMAVRERGWVAWAAPGLLGVWALWCYGFVQSLTKKRRWWVASAAGVVLASGWFLAVPGPWAHDRPVGGRFQMEGEAGGVAGVVVTGGVATDGVEPLGEMPVQGSWLLTVKKALSFLRPVLHVLLFAGPAFVIAGLCGAKCAWWCGVLISCAVEAAQAGFGYGFDWLDGVDLLVDWAGIGGAIWVFRAVETRLPMMMKSLIRKEVFPRATP